MSPLTSPDAKAVVRALEALTTQVRRIADARTTPVVEDAEAQQTTADDVPRCVCGDPIEQTGDPAYWIHSPGSDTRCLDARPPSWVTRGTRDLSIPKQGPATGEEQTLQWARRESLLVLLTRLQRGRTLTEEEAATLRHHVETEIREAAIADAVTAETKRLLERRTETLRERAKRAEHERDVVAADLETADRIRAEAQRDRDQHAAVLAEVLATFVHKVDGYRIPRVRSGEVDVVTLERWRSFVAPTVERPWWETLAEVRAELEETQAELDRIRRALDPDDDTYIRETVDDQLAMQAREKRVRSVVKLWAPKALPHSEAHRLLADVRTALDGTEQPATEE